MDRTPKAVAPRQLGVRLTLRRRRNGNEDAFGAHAAEVMRPTDARARPACSTVGETAGAALTGVKPLDLAAHCGACVERARARSAVGAGKVVARPVCARAPAATRETVLVTDYLSHTRV